MRFFVITLTVFSVSIICLYIYDSYQRTKQVCATVIEVGGCNRGMCRVKLSNGNDDHVYLPLVGDQECWWEKP